MANTEPRNSLSYNWTATEAYGTAMDNNLKRIGSLLNVSAIDITNTPPVSPVNGDTYIVGAAGTGAFTGNNNRIAIYYTTPAAAWVFYPATKGLLAFIQTGTFADQLVAFNGTAWSTNGFTFTF